jgi:hypothetical protein
MLNGYKPNIKVGNSFALIPEAMYTLQIVDVDPEVSTYMGTDKNVLAYKFAILDSGKDDEGGEIRGRFIWKRCSESMNSKSWLYMLVTAAYGHAPTEEEIVAFDAEALIGKQVQAMVEQKTKKDGSGVYNNILKFSKATKQLEAVAYESKSQTIEKTSQPLTVDEEVDKITKEINK